jgi:hypothetical protein
LHQARMRELVDDDVIVAAHQPDDSAEAGGPARGEQQHVVHIHQLGNLGFELARERRVALQHRRGGGVRAVLHQRADAGVADGRVLREAQVILRAEVVARDDAVVLATDACDRRGRLFERARVRPGVELCALGQPLAQRPGALGQVRPFRLNEHAEMFSKSVRLMDAFILLLLGHHDSPRLRCCRDGAVRRPSDAFILLVVMSYRRKCFLIN